MLFKFLKHEFFIKSIPNKHFLAIGMQAEKNKTIGITNRVFVNGKLNGYTIFADYDETELQDVVKIWERLSKVNYLGHVYIFQTREDKKHFQVICPCILNTMGELTQLLQESACDYLFRMIGYGDGYYILRAFPKDGRREFPEPKLVYTIKKGTRRRYHETLLLFLACYYACPIPKQRKKVKSKLEMVGYETRNFQ